MSPAKLAITKTEKEKTLLIILAGAIILMAYFHFLIKPAIGDLRELMPKVSELKSDLAMAKTLILNRPSIEKRKKDLKAKIDKYEKIFPREREIPRLLENFSDIAKASGVKIIGIRPITSNEYGSGEESSTYQAIPIEVIALSGYHELGRFLQKLETGERFIKLKDFSIRANPTSAKRHEVMLIAETFILKEDE